MSVSLARDHPPPPLLSKSSVHFIISGCQSWKAVWDPQTPSPHHTDEIITARGLREESRPQTCHSPVAPANPTCPKPRGGTRVSQGPHLPFSGGNLICSQPRQDEVK